MKMGFQGDEAWPRLMQISACLFLLICLLGRSEVLYAGVQFESVPQDQNRPISGYTLVLHAGSVQTPWLRAKATVEAEFDFSSSDQPLSSLSLVLEDVNIRANQDWVSISTITLQARGMFDARGYLSFEEVSCQIGDRAVGMGSLTQKARGWQGNFVLYPANLVDEFASVWPWLSHIEWKESTHGGMEVDLTWRPGSSDRPPVLEGGVQTKNHIRWRQPKTTSTFIMPPLATSFKINLEDGNINWTLGSGDDLQWRDVIVIQPEAQGSFQLLSPGFKIMQAEVKTRLANKQKKGFEGAAMHIRAQGVDIWSQETRMEKLTLHLQDLGEVQARGRWGARDKSVLEIRADGLQLSGIQTWLRAAGLGSGPGLDVQGGVDFQADIEKGDDTIRGNWKTDLDNVGGAFADGQIMAAGIHGHAEGSVNWGTQPQISFSLQATQGEMLWGTRYANLEQAPFSMQSRGELRSDREVRFTELTGRIGDFIHLQAQGRMDVISDQPEWEIQVEESRVQLEPLSTIVQGLLPSGWNVQGRMDWTGSISRIESGPQVRGRLVGHQLSLDVPEAGIKLKDWGFELPVYYRMGRPIDDDASPNGHVPWGVLRPGGLQIAQRDVELTGADIRLAENILEVRQRVKVQSLGLRAELGQLRVQLPWTGEWRARGEVRLSDLRLARIMAFGPDNMGRLQGGLQLNVSAQRVQTEGRIQGNLFGGDVLIENIGVKRPLDSSRMLQADVAIHGLDLEPLSNSLEIGRITGKMDIDVHKMGIAYGQPVRFHMRAASVPEPEKSRKISLQAVNSLSIIGTGQGLSGLGIQFYAQFFKQFPYEQIGLSCVLANDVFSLNGLIQDQGVEYIVKRGWTGINVINTNPNNVIAFSDMLDRLERVYAQAE